MTEKPTNPFERGPYVHLATFCENVLQETTGVISLIRSVDVVTHVERGTNPPQEMPEFHYPLTLVISLKSGTARGRHNVKVVPRMPSQETLPPQDFSVNMEGEGKGVNLILKMDTPYKYEGLYWFDIIFDGNLITCIPLEVRYSRMAVSESK